MATSFVAELFHWRGPSPYYWLRLPEDAYDHVREQAGAATYGWGVVPVAVRVGDTDWETSLLPRDGGYLLPVKKVVRLTEQLGDGEPVTVSMTVAPRRGRAANGTGPTM